MKPLKYFIWRRLVRTPHLEEWLQRLEFVEDRLVVTQKPSGLRVQIDLYCKNIREANSFREKFKGTSRTLLPKAWLSTQERDFQLCFPPYFCVTSNKKSGSLPAIYIPAHMAFGTGEHATTAMCLKQLTQLHQPGLTLLDVGTGSGILAFAARLLGYRVTAFDIDPDCIHEAKENAKRNPHIPSITWRTASVKKFSPAQPFDHLAANLYADCLIPNMLQLKTWLKKGGVMILSGILKEQVAHVIQTARKNHLKLERTITRGKWVCLVLIHG